MVHAQLCYINYSFFSSLFNVRFHSHVYTQQFSLHVWVSASLWALKPLCESWTSSLTRSPCLMDFFLHQCVIHRPLVRHPWEPAVNPTWTSMGNPHVHFHRNLVPLLFSTISNIPLLGFFSRIFVCRLFRLVLFSLGRDHEHLTIFTAHYNGL